MTWPTWSLTEVLASRPSIRVNQIGYLPDGLKRATWVTDRPEPSEFTVQAGDGAELFRGRSAPWPERPERTSGMSVHVLDFSPLRASAGTCRVVAGGEASHPFRVDSALYEQLGPDALGLFYLLRSGCPIDDVRAPGYGRPAGHVGKPPNQGDTAVPAWTSPDADRLYPGWRQSGLFNVSGGWYDAGDYGKYTVSGGIALWQLLVLAELQGHHSPGDAAPVLEECRWQLDWMLRMQVPTGQPLAGMAFHRVHGTTWSPLPGWAHEDPTARVLHRPSTAASLHLAATAAFGARLFARIDAPYAERLLAAARTAQRAAHAHPDLYAPDDEGRYGGGPYGDDDVSDDFYWAAAELWLTTGESGFQAELERSARHTDDAFELDGFDFDRVAAPAHLDLALGLTAGVGRADRRLPDQARVEAGVVAAAARMLDLEDRQPWGQPYAPTDGWDWGSNGRILNNLVVLAAAHRLTGDRRFRDGVAGGMDYLLGRNALGQSYVTGYGTQSTRHQRTRQFGHDLDGRFPPPPAGALAGGANSKDTPGFPGDPRLAGLPPQCCYLDEPTSETTNDICIRWNAPLAYVAAYLQLTASRSTRT
jgi:endoglucanase